MPKEANDIKNHQANRNMNDPVGRVLVSFQLS